LIKIGIFKKGDIVGLKDIEYEEASIYNVECISERGEIIKLRQSVII
jgi:hypothetical protein